MKTQYSSITKTFILVVLLALFCPMGILAQQVITFKSGFTCQAVITYFSVDTVRYQLVSNPGVTFTVPMSDVEKISDDGNAVKGKDKSYYENNLKKFTRMTIAGGAILGTGAVLTLTGIIGMHNNNEYEYYNGYNTYEHTSAYKTYATITAVSSVLVVTGTVFTIIGGANRAGAKKELKKFNIQVEPNPAISGMTVRVKF